MPIEKQSLFRRAIKQLLAKKNKPVVKHYKMETFLKNRGKDRLAANIGQHSIEREEFKTQEYYNCTPGIER